MGKSIGYVAIMRTQQITYDLGHDFDVVADVRQKDGMYLDELLERSIIGGIDGVHTDGPHI